MSSSFEGSALMTMDLVEEAVGLTLNVIDDMMRRNGELSGEHLHIVVMDPTKPSGGSYRFEQAILYEYSIGKRADWEHRFDIIARDKARRSWATGRNTLDQVMSAPHLFQRGNVSFWGSAVHNGIVVACSGVQPWFDQMFSYIVAACCEGLCHNRMQKIMATSDKMFIGDALHSHAQSQVQENVPGDPFE